MQLFVGPQLDNSMLHGNRQGELPYGSHGSPAKQDKIWPQPSFHEALQERTMREASLTFIRWEPQVKSTSWKDSRKREVQRFGDSG